jgi:hypothetical protein
MKKNYFDDLPSWSKGVISVVGFGAIVYIGYQIYTNYKSLFNRDTQITGICDH